MKVAMEAAKRACNLDPKIKLEGFLIKDELHRFISNCRGLEVEQELPTIQADLFPRNPLIKNLVREVISETILTPLFQDDSKLVGWRLVKCWLDGIRMNPRLLRNRGVWMLGFTRLVRSARVGLGLGH